MQEVNPLVIILGFVLRCGVPLLVMLAVSYLFFRFGLIQDTAEPPDRGAPPGEIPPGNHPDTNGGDWLHGKV